MTGDAPLIDRAHLDAQTAGDAALADEVLGLFEEQLDRLAPLVLAPGPDEARIDAAHTLKGSARGVGAMRVAACAEAVERGLRAGRLGAAEREALAEAVSRTRDTVATIRSRAP